MNMKTTHLITAAASAAFALAAQTQFVAPAAAQNAVPHYEADPAWPKPLPNRWILGGLGGLCVDAQDHVVILNRQDILEGELTAGSMAPSIIEFDPAGNVVNSWSNPQLLDSRLHSCHFDKDGNFWVAAAPSGVVQKFTHDGSKLLLQIGKKGVLDSSDGTIKGKPLNSRVPAVPHAVQHLRRPPERRCLCRPTAKAATATAASPCMDREGRFLRQWLPEGMENVHCMTISNDGLVYVCNRDNARIQVYDKQGNFQRNIEVPWKPYTPPADGKVKQFGGAAVAIDFSPDPAQTYIFVINQNNSEIEIIERQSGKLVGSFGSIGKLPGQLDQPHGIAVDSKGNVYVDENRGRRVHKFRVVL